MLGAYRNIWPQLAEDCFVAENAAVVGDVRLAAGSSVWFNSVLRGDVAPIILGKNCNIQDNSTLHGIPDGPVILGDNVAVGHGVIIHASTVEDCCLIGMGAVVLDSSLIGRGSIIGAGAVVPPRSVIPPYSLVMGVPAKVIRTLDPAIEQERIRHCQHYREMAAEYLAEMEKEK